MKTENQDSDELRVVELVSLRWLKFKQCSGLCRGGRGLADSESAHDIQRHTRHLLRTSSSSSMLRSTDIPDPDIKATRILGFWREVWSMKFYGISILAVETGSAI